MKLLKILFIGFLGCFISMCNSSSDNNIKSGEQLYNQYCSTCHLPTDPINLTKDIWKNSVLPRMGWRLGVRNISFSPFDGLSSEERKSVEQSKIYPEEQLVTDQEWSSIVEYVLRFAPDSIAFDSTRISRTKESSLFTRKDIPVDRNYGSNITAIEFDKKKKELWFANFNKQVYHWSKRGQKDYSFSSPVVDFSFSDEGVLFTEIGKLFPTALKSGSISHFNGKQKLNLLNNMHRPVQSELLDLNKDGIKELVVAEYGNDTGRLCLYQNINGQWQDYVLINQPGAIKFYILDYNKDNRLDIIALFAQGDESIYVFLQEDNFSFSTQRLLRFPPEYGTSDFVVLDFDQDGDLDFITANGDNADYSYILKPYHGVRIFINEDNNFNDKKFLPIYGATKVVAEDFDFDGDYDLVVSSFFPDFNVLLSESFLFLENTNSSTLDFSYQTVSSDTPIRSLTMAKADYDGDGDQDVILGLFDISPQSLPDHLIQKWKSSTFDLSVFLNNSNPSQQ